MKVQLSRGQWGVLFLLLGAIALELVFSPYWQKFYQSEITTGNGVDKKIKITTEGLMVLAFLVFGTVMILLLSSVQYKAGLTIAALIFLSVVLARGGPIIDWLDATTEALKKASGS